MRWALAACGIVAMAFAQAPADPLVEAASAYVAKYQEQLTSIVADERYTQHVRAQIPRDSGMPRARTTSSEIFFMYVPGHDWMAVRDVTTIDGRPVTDGLDLKGALGKLALPDVARQFKEFNSRYNLGHIVRTFNEPTLSLLVLDARHRGRFTFTRGRSSSARGVKLQAVTFRETAGPTLIRSLEGGNVYSRGEFTLEAETGRIRRALLALEIGTVRISLSTAYEEDRRLGMLVPVRFGELYKDGAAARVRSRDVDATAPYEEIVCEAKYSNFRRFEVKAIVR